MRYDARANDLFFWAECEEHVFRFCVRNINCRVDPIEENRRCVKGAVASRDGEVDDCVRRRSSFEISEQPTSFTLNSRQLFHC